MTVTESRPGTGGLIESAVHDAFLCFPHAVPPQVLVLVLHSTTVVGVTDFETNLISPAADTSPRRCCVVIVWFWKEDDPVFRRSVTSLFVVKNVAVGSELDIHGLYSVSTSSMFMTHASFMPASSTFMSLSRVVMATTGTTINMAVFVFNAKTTVFVGKRYLH